MKIEIKRLVEKLNSHPACITGLIDIEEVKLFLTELQEKTIPIRELRDGNTVMDINGFVFNWDNSMKGDYFPIEVNSLWLIKLHFERSVKIEDWWEHASEIIIYDLTDGGVGVGGRRMPFKRKYVHELQNLVFEIIR